MSSEQGTGTQHPEADYRIALSVLETIVRSVVAADPAVRLHQGSRLGRGRALEIIVAEGRCRVSLGLDAHLGDHLPTVAAEVRQRVVEHLESFTGLSVEAVDVSVVSVMPAAEPV